MEKGIEALNQLFDMTCQAPFDELQEELEKKIGPLEDVRVSDGDATFKSAKHEWRVLLSELAAGTAIIYDGHSSPHHETWLAVGCIHDHRANWLVFT